MQTKDFFTLSWLFFIVVYSSLKCNIVDSYDLPIHDQNDMGLFFRNFFFLKRIFFSNFINNDPRGSILGSKWPPGQDI